VFFSIKRSPLRTVEAVEKQKYLEYLFEKGNKN
jgi:hypothetical protein